MKRQNLVLLSIGWLCCTACSSGPDVMLRSPSPAERKSLLLRRMENGMAQIKDYVQPRFDDIRYRAEVELAALETPIRLQVIDPVLTRYGEEDEENFREDIDAIVDRCVDETEILLAQTEKGVRNHAYDIAQTDVRSDSEFSTGFDDLDAMVEDAIDSVRANAAIPKLEDMGYFRRGEVLRLAQSFRFDRPNVGRMALYLSPPIKDAVLIDQESQAAVLTFINKGEEIAEDVPLELVQAVRKRLMRAGVPVADTGWRLDPDARNGDGVLPLDEANAAPGYLISQLSFPIVNTTSPEFYEIYDHTVRYEYESAVRRKDTGEFLVGIRWELKWLATRKGPLISVESRPARSRLDSFEILGMLLGGEAYVSQTEDADAEKLETDSNGES